MTKDSSFTNVYEDAARAAAYATLDFPGTYFLAFRDLPDILARHVQGRRALDFGCGAGRSTRFLEKLGFQATGVDISAQMIELAQRIDPAGAYRLIPDGDFSAFAPDSLDLILCAFTFDNIPGRVERATLLRGLSRLLRASGRIVLLGSTPDIYTHEWASFTTKDFPGNRVAKSGDLVFTVMKDVADRRPVVDILWTHADYLGLFQAANLDLVAEYRPIARPDEASGWISELTVAPWVIYVIGSTVEAPLANR